jgi:hypothetical protein
MHVKKILAVALACVFFLAGAAYSAGVTVMMDGRTLTFDQQPVMQGGRVLVPLRGIFENLGATVTYQPATRDIIATRGTTTVHLTLDSRNATVNNNPVTLDVPAQSFSGRTVVPLRFISEALGANVKWISASQTVLITQGDMAGTPAPPAPVPSPPVTTTRPAIDAIVLNTHNALRPGDTLIVTATGTPGATATFDLTGVENGIPMREISAGRYEGRVTVSSGWRQGSTPLLVSFVKDGLTAVRQAPLAVTIGNTTTPNRIFVNITSPLSGTVVNETTEIRGLTMPFATVNVEAKLRRPLIPGIIDVDTRTITSRVQADASGQFSVPLVLGSQPNGTTMELRVSATDTAGNTSDTQSYTVSVGD